MRRRISGRPGARALRSQARAARSAPPACITGKPVALQYRISEMVDRCYVLRKGAVVYEATAEALRVDEDVKHRYLGV